jgi:hypothetical protein
MARVHAARDARCYGFMPVPGATSSIVILIAAGLFRRCRVAQDYNPDFSPISWAGSA